MRRRHLWFELALPFVACLVVVAAALSRSPAILALLSIAWFAPQLLRTIAAGSRLDERERRLSDIARQTALSALLVLATLLPLLWSLGGRGALEEIRAQGLDLGFLLVGIFFLRGAVLGAGALPRLAAAHHAGAFATLVCTVGVVGNAVLFPGRVAAWLVAAPLLCLLPHAVAAFSRGLAALLWLGGAMLTGAWTLALTGGITVIEQVAVLALMATPWALAATWSAGGLIRPAPEGTVHGPVTPGGSEE